MGKAAAAAIGSGIIILQIANHNGYIKINWDKVTKNAEKVSEQLEEKPSKSNLMKKVSILQICSKKWREHFIFPPEKFHFPLCVA